MKAQGWFMVLYLFWLESPKWFPYVWTGAELTPWNWNNEFTIVFLLQVQSDLEQGIYGAVPIPSDDAGKEEVIAALVANVEAMIKADRKVTALKQLQGKRKKKMLSSSSLKSG